MGEPWVPLSHRYGIASERDVIDWCAKGDEHWPDETWRSRHAREATSVEPPEALFRCICPGSGATWPPWPRS